jgi:hypothetical protein
MYQRDPDRERHDGRRARLSARWVRFWHCLRYSVSPYQIGEHRAITAHDAQGRPTGIGCSCGRVFWMRSF